MQEAIEQQERLQNAGVLARTVGFLGALYLATGRLKEARPLLQRAVSMYREAGDFRESVAQLKNLALTAYYENELDEAKTHLDEVLSITGRDANVHQYADAVNLYGNVLRKEGALKQAMEKHAAALQLAPELEGSHYLAEILEDTSMTFEALGDDRSAALAAGGAHALRERLRSPMNPVAMQELLEAKERARARLGAERYDALFLRGQATLDSGLLAEVEGAIPRAQR
jgi:tetratricopeptide (TPR) repeat protein